MSDAPFRLPRVDEHTTIVGRNGTGKSQFGAHLLSMQDLRAMPWIVTDYKGEELFNSIPRIREIGFNDVPKHPGLYLLHSRPDLGDEMERFLWRQWEAERRGIFVDEGYMLPQPAKGGAYQGILTQGRSKSIPVITLSQRPVLMSRFAFSEAAHIVVFDLNDRRDWKTVAEITPEGFTDWLPPELPSVDGKLPKYHSRWYNVKDNSRFIVKPVPDAYAIIERIDAQLEPKRMMV